MPPKRIGGSRVDLFHVLDSSVAGLVIEPQLGAVFTICVWKKWQGWTIQPRSILRRVCSEMNTDKKDMTGRGEKPGPTISLCMIVKNEEQFLEKCLESVCRYVDEIVIVDTGSEDGTVEIAERFTENVYHHPWEDSFSKARNIALQYATCDWVFQIDGDEELLPGGGEELLKSVRDAGDADIVFVSILSGYSNGTRMASHNFERLFRNNGKIHYEGAVHNRIVGGTMGMFSKVRLLHHGYDVKGKKAKQKFERTTTLLKAEIHKDPKNPLHHHYLGTSYLSRGMNMEAAKEAELAIELSDAQKNDDPIYLWAHFIAATAYYGVGNLDKAWLFAEKGYKKANDHIDSLYMLTVVAAEWMEWKMVTFYGMKYLEILRVFRTNPEKAGIYVNNTLKESHAVYIFLGHACHAQNDKKGMEECYDLACRQTDVVWKVLWSIGGFHLDKTGDLELAKRYLNWAKEVSPSEPDVWYKLAKYYKETASPEEEKDCLLRLFQSQCVDAVVINRLITLCIETMDLEIGYTVARKAKKAYPESSFLLRSLSLIHRKRGEFSEAIGCLSEMLRKDPHASDGWFELGKICFEIGKTGDAKNFFEKALKISPTRVDVLLKLCIIDAKMQDLNALSEHVDLILKRFELNVGMTVKGIGDLHGVLIEMEAMLKDDARLAQDVNRLTTTFENEFRVYLPQVAKSTLCEASPGNLHR